MARVRRKSVIDITNQASRILDNLSSDPNDTVAQRRSQRVADKADRYRINIYNSERNRQLARRAVRLGGQAATDIYNRMAATPVRREIYTGQSKGSIGG